MPIATPLTIPATVTSQPAANAADVDPLGDVSVSASDGTLTTVSMVKQQ